MIIHPEYIGIDVSKDHLDIFDAASGRSERIANASEPIAALVARWQGRNVFVVFEATGHYDRTLRTALAQSGIRYARINPARARDFARARGLLGKTDAIDARMLAALGQGLSPAAQAPIDLSRDELALAHKRRDQLVHVRQKERTRRSECSQAELAADIDAHLAWLDARIAQWDAIIARLVAKSAALAQAWRRLRGIPGIGPVAATTLLACMPEIGSLTPTRAAALAGLAPFNRDSGRFRGRRKIAGGRKRVRDALYMAALAAARCHVRFRAIYQRLLAAGKPPKLALIAIARKLLLVANAILRDNTAFQT
jgi:transposase